MLPGGASQAQEAGGEPAEDHKPTAQDSGPATTNNQERPADDKSEHLKTGEKREHDSTAALVDTDKPAADGSNAPDAKKQKTTEDTAKVVSGAPASAAAVSEANGEKKKAGRPKKGRDTAKKERPITTDGIGSRTRSRTKAA